VNKYPEIPSSTFRIIDGITYFVRKYGLNGVVCEERLEALPETPTAETPRQMFDRLREQKFEETKWVRERHYDNLEASIDDSANWRAWLAYWQALRDMPEQEGFSEVNPNWPVQPE